MDQSKFDWKACQLKLLDYAVNFYGRVYDPCLRFLSNLLSDEKVIRERLAKEEGFSGEFGFTHPARLISFQHERASTLLTHISIMIALVGIIAGLGGGLAVNYRIFASFETFLYLVIALCLIRCLREFGLDRDYTDGEDYKVNLMAELAFRFSLVRFANLITIFVTLLFILGSLLALLFAV